MEFVGRKKAQKYCRARPCVEFVRFRTSKDLAFFARKVVRSLAQSARWRIHVVARETSASEPGLRWSRHVRSFHTVGGEITDAAYVREIARIVRDTGASVILPVVEATSLLCIQHREELEKSARLAPLPSAEMFTTAIDKGLLAGFTARQGIPHPKTWLADDLDRGTRTFPVLVKPRRSSGGQGVVLVNSEEELQQELARRDRSDVCIQEQVEGTDMGCSVLVRDGRIEAWTTQRGVHRPRGFSAYSEIQMEEQPAVFQVTARLMRALNWSGVANVDFRVDARTGEALVLEVNGRYWDSLLASTAAGVNFPDAVCRATLGEELNVSSQRAGRFVQPRRVLKDLLRLRSRAFRRQWTSLPILLADPLPELMSVFSRSAFGRYSRHLTRSAGATVGCMPAVVV